MDSRRAAAVSSLFLIAAVPMRSAFFSLVLVACLAVPAAAQRLADLPGRTPAVAPATRLTPGSLFNARTLQFSQSVEMTYAGGAGGSLGQGIYTGSLQWQPSAKLAGRVDVGVAQNLFATGAVPGALGADSGQPQLFLRNAEIAYRPTANSLLHLSVQQSPYGAYASPYGAYGNPTGYGYGAAGTSRFGASFGSDGADRLFFRDGQ